MNLLTIATILGIIIVLSFLLFIFFDIRKLLKQKDSVEKEDIESNRCPDFFESTVKDGRDICLNTHKLGSGKDFYPSDNKYNDLERGDFNKCEWARTNNVPWDGIDRLC